MSFFSKTSLLGGIDNYANTPPVELYAKKTVATESANANLVLNSRDRNTGKLTTKRSQPYNNFILQKGFPILQGQINSLKVDEVVMPIPPNINSNNNTASVYTFDGTGAITGQFDIVSTVLGTGFYTGNQMAVKLTGTAGIAGLGLSVQYNTDGTFTWLFNAVAPSVGWGISPLLPANFVGNKSDIVNLFATIPPEAMGLIWTLGFNNYYSNSFDIQTGIYRTGVASLAYTEYIDVCSDVLTQYQELTDTATDTTNPAHIICRVYINNETSMPTLDASGCPVLPGCVYTKLHRQFKNPKVIRWNGQNSIDRIDLQLFDDLGRPLYWNVKGNDDFQITFSATEM